MKPISKISPFLLIILLSSCGILSGPDPAEALADQIQVNAQEMRERGIKSKEFGFLPNPKKMKATSSEANPTALLELAYSNDKGGSVLCFNKWYWTTYQNRFVWIPRSMSVSKAPGEAFVIKLTKVKDSVHLTEIR